MAKNLGKQFEAQIRKDFKRATTPHYLLRLYDQMSGYSHVQTPCDFTLFAKGGGVDGQVLVIHDMLGISQSFSPRFLRRYLNLADEIKGAVGHYVQDVKSCDFPNEKEQY